MGYTKSAISGFSWHTMLKILSYGLVLIKMFFLARLLGPEAFGIFSLTMIALGITEAMTETGINVTLIQSQKPVAYFVDTAWVIAIVRGFLIGMCMIMLGWGLSEFYGQPQLVTLVAMAALIPVIKGFINPAIITFYKDLSFKWDSVYRFSLVLADVVLAVLLVTVTRSVEGWIGALVLAAIFEVAVSFFFFTPRPRFAFDSKKAKEIWVRAKWLSLSSLFSYLHENVDNLIVGKIVGTYNLGLYQNAYALAHKPNYDISRSVHHSTLPIYVRFQADLPRLKRAFRRTMATTAGLAVVLSLPLFIAPRMIILIILGEQWLAIAPFLGWLVLAGLIQALTLSGYTTMLATNNLKWLNFHQALTVGLLICLVIISGSALGLVGVAMAVATSRLLTFPILLYGVKKVFSRSV